VVETGLVGIGPAVAGLCGLGPGAGGVGVAADSGVLLAELSEGAFELRDEGFWLLAGQVFCGEPDCDVVGVVEDDGEPRFEGRAGLVAGDGPRGPDGRGRARVSPSG
jgi:hypothetical protein